jgi:Transmembrane amino acid transporter protein
VLEVSAGLVEHSEELPDTAAASPSSSSSPAASAAASPLTDVEAAAMTTSATKQCDSATLTAGAANCSTMYGSTAPARMTVKRSSLPAPCITSAAAMRHKPRSPSMLEGAPAAAAAAKRHIPRRTSLLNILAPPLPEPVYKTSNAMPLWHRRRSLLGARASLIVSPRTLHRGVVQQAQATAELRKARPRYSPSPKAVRSTASSSTGNAAGSSHSRSPAAAAAAAAVPASSAASPLLPLHSTSSPVAKQHQQQQQQQLCCASVSTDAARNWLRPAVVCCTAAAALLVPDVGLAVALAGSVGGSVLNLVLPPLIELRLETSPSLRQYAVSAVIVTAGVVCGVVGTAQAFSAIAESYAKH